MALYLSILQFFVFYNSNSPQFLEINSIRKETQISFWSDPYSHQQLSTSAVVFWISMISQHLPGIDPRRSSVHHLSQQARVCSSKLHPTKGQAQVSNSFHFSLFNKIGKFFLLSLTLHLHFTLLNLFFNWRKIALQCCNGFCHTTQINHHFASITSLLSLPLLPTSHPLSHQEVPG